MNKALSLLCCKEAEIKSGKIGLHIRNGKTDNLCTNTGIVVYAVFS